MIFHNNNNTQSTNAEDGLRQSKDPSKLQIHPSTVVSGGFFVSLGTDEGFNLC